MNNKGCVHIYHGDGKGKTTAGIGLCVRAAGAGMKVMMYQFMKDNSSSERKVLKAIEGITLIDGDDLVKFSFQMTAEEIEASKIHYREVFDKLTKKAIKENVDLLFMDEILHVVNKGFLQEEELLKFLDERPESMEVVLTGYHPSERLLERADYVTCMVKEKHPYDRHLAARAGIEM